MSTMYNTKEKENPCLEHWFHMSISTQIGVKHDEQFHVEHI